MLYLNALTVSECELWFYFSPSGIRIGTPAVTTRGFGLEDMDRVAGFIHEGVQIALKVASGIKTVAIKKFEVRSTVRTLVSRSTQQPIFSYSRLRCETMWRFKPQFKNSNWRCLNSRQAFRYLAFFKATLFFVNVYAYDKGFRMFHRFYC